MCTGASWPEYSPWSRYFLTCRFLAIGTSSTTGVPASSVSAFFGDLRSLIFFLAGSGSSSVTSLPFAQVVYMTGLVSMWANSLVSCSLRSSLDIGGWAFPVGFVALLPRKDGFAAEVSSFPAIERVAMRPGVGDGCSMTFDLGRLRPGNCHVGSEALVLFPRRLFATASPLDRRLPWIAVPLSLARLYTGGAARCRLARVLVGVVAAVVPGVTAAGVSTGLSAGSPSTIELASSVGTAMSRSMGSGGAWEASQSVWSLVTEPLSALE